MAVQAGEGTEDIIYGSTSIPAGPAAFGGYLARPDGQFEWPTVLVYGPELTPTSPIKNICRIFARHGIAALSPDLTGEPERDRRIGKAIAAFIAAPNGDWSNAEYGFGVIAFGSGIDRAGALAATEGLVVVGVAIAAPFSDTVVDDLAEADIPILYVASRGDDTTDVDAVIDRRDRLPRATFAVYADGDDGFWNDDAAGFRDDRFDDAMERAIGFASDRLPVRL